MQLGGEDGVSVRSRGNRTSNHAGRYHSHSTQGYTTATTVQGGPGRGPVGLPAAAGPGADRPDSPVVPHLQTRTGRPVPCTGWERGSGTQWEAMNGTRESFIRLIKNTY